MGACSVYRPDLEKGFIFFVNIGVDIQSEGKK